jgi:hypothetical protein
MAPNPTEPGLSPATTTVPQSNTQSIQMCFLRAWCMPGPKGGTENRSAYRELSFPTPLTPNWETRLIWGNTKLEVRGGEGCFRKDSH